MPMPSRYMIGDNPASGTIFTHLLTLASFSHTLSDIAGAGAAKWDSILVKTGVYDPKHGPPAHTPTHIANDVYEAVRWAIEQEYYRSSLRPDDVGSE